MLLERQKLVDDLRSGVFTMTEACERRGITRPTGYHWLKRADEEGKAGLVERSRAPHSCPHRMSPEIAEALLEVRRTHPSWGPKKLIDRCRTLQPQTLWPAPSSVGELLRREGLIESKKRRRHHLNPGSGRPVAERPNQVWTADHKGHFKLLSGDRTYPLTVMDLFSRRLLVCDALSSTRLDEAKRCFEWAFREYGLPDAIRTDNGPPFASQALHGFTTLNAWWMKLGIVHQRIRPGAPQDNGAHERMHRTLKNHCCCPGKRSFLAQQRAFNAFCREYNEERPHEALAGETPDSRYVSSERTYDGTAPEPEYPAHFDVKRVTTAGEFRLHSKAIFITTSLINELVGLEEVEDGIWAVYFGRFLIAKIDERDNIVRS